jgi:hypothetical protein
MINITEPIHVLTYRFQNESIYHKEYGNYTDLRDFVNDFNSLDILALLNCHYIKKNNLGNFNLSDRLIEHFINPLPDKLDLSRIKEKQTAQTAQTASKVGKSLLKPIAQSVSYYVKANNEHKACFIHLYEHTTVTCSETGISFSCQLPIPGKLNLEVIHPLSFYSNVRDVIRTYSNQGIFLESELSAQVLSGMLLTILKHKKLLICHDYVQANLCLQHAKIQTLSSAVRYFNGISSSLSMPQLHLIPEAIYDFFHAPISLTKEQIIADRVEVMIQNFIKVCKGESEGETRIAGTILKTKQEKIGAKVKIYGGNIDIEHRQALGREKLGKQILAKLQTLFPVPTFSQAFYDMLYSKLDAFMFLGTEKRVEISKQIVEKFGEHKLGRQLAELFATTKTETMELGLTTFSQELEQNLGEWKGQKRRFNLFASKVVNEKENKND